jgi:hypothetical protein
MHYRYLGSIFGGLFTGEAIGYYPKWRKELTRDLEAPALRPARVGRLDPDFERVAALELQRLRGTGEVERRHPHVCFVWRIANDIYGARENDFTAHVDLGRWSGMEKLLSYASQDGAESGVYVKVCAEHVMTTLEINDAGMANRLFKTAETSYGAPSYFLCTDRRYNTFNMLIMWVQMHGGKTFSVGIGPRASDGPAHSPRDRHPDHTASQCVPDAHHIHVVCQILIIPLRTGLPQRHRSKILDLQL